MMIKLLLSTILIATSNLVIAQFQEELEVTHAIPGPEKTFSIDLDEDGDNDLVVYSSVENSLYFLENEGQGQFGLPRMIIDSIVYSNAGFNAGVRISFEDIDGDGLKDIITNAAWYRAGWFKGYGNGKFSESAFVLLAPVYSKMTYAADMNGDGAMDILVGFPNHEIYLFENQGNGVFGSGLNIVGCQLIYEMVDWEIFDKDGDGDLDLLLAGYNYDQLVFLINDGGGSFSSSQLATLSDGPVGVEVAKFENGGFDQICLISNGDNTLRVVSKTGFTFFSAQLITSFNLTELYVSDLNGDNLNDILVRNAEGDGWLFTNNGNYLFTQTDFNYLVSENAGLALFADLNNDNLDELLMTDVFTGKITVRTNVAGDFPESYELIDCSSDADVVFGDLNNDGKNDIVTAAKSGLKIYLNESGEFILNQLDDSFVAINTRIRCATGDLDLDGDLDIAFVRNDSLYVMKNDSLGALWTRLSISNGNLLAYYNIYLVDLDNDLDLDILEYGFGGIKWTENLGGLSFAPTQIINLSGDNKSCTPFDFDSDNDIDIFAVFDSPPRYMVYENVNGTFSQAQTIYNVPNNQMITKYLLNDYDNDGDLDIFHMNLSEVIGMYNLYLLENNNGIFNPLLLADSSKLNFNARLAGYFDFDGDLLKDVLLFGPNTNGMGGAVFWMKNNGGGFNQAVKLSEFVETVENATCIDIDNDSDQDVFISTEYRLFSIKNSLFAPGRAIGCIFYDQNLNGVKDTNESGISSILVKSDATGYYSYNQNGNYFVDYSSDSFVPNTIQMDLSSDWFITSDSLSYLVQLDSLNTVMDSLDFGIYPDTIYTALSNEIVESFSICDELSKYWVTIKNEGTTVISGAFQVVLDDDLTFVSSSVTPDSIVAQSIFFSFDSLFFYEDTTVEITVMMPGFNSLGSAIDFKVITTVENDSTIVQVDSVSKILLCAYDPNDKIGVPIPNDADEILIDTDKLTYTIRFQNTGNFYAKDVIIVDTLSSQLDWSTIKKIKSSHDMIFDLNQFGVLTFRFLDINLPDTSISFIESQGFLSFEVELKDSLESGTIIENTGYIYFDYNPAIVTNTVRHILVEFEEIEPFTDEGDVLIYPNPSSGSVTIYYNSETTLMKDILITNYLGSVVLAYNNINSNKFSIPAKSLHRGVFLVICKTDDGQKVKRLIIND